jgi:hypothetical protein
MAMKAGNSEALGTMTEGFVLDIHLDRQANTDICCRAMVEKDNATHCQSQDW